MEKKFLIFSCLLLLVSIVYFIYTSYQLQIENRNQQETPGEPSDTFPRGIANPYALKSEQENSNFEPTKEEWEEFEPLFRDFKESKEVETSQSEANLETGNLEIDVSEAKISPELEAMFITLKKIKNQQRSLYEEAAPFFVELSELRSRLIEIGTNDLVKADREQTKRLHEELTEIQERSVVLRSLVKPYDERIQELENEFVHEYGMSNDEFHKKHGSAYRSWKANP